MAEISEAIARPKGRVKSCTSCRQVKVWSFSGKGGTLDAVWTLANSMRSQLRCDAVTKFPAACSRCSIHGLDCRIDSNFKRVSVRG
jgi:hypothetical protein